MTTPVSTLDSHIVYAHQQMKRAQAEDDFAGIVLWMSRIDELLDRRVSPLNAGVQDAPTAAAEH